MDRTAVLWGVVLFFGSSLVFIGLRRLTEDQPAGVVVAVQVGALVAVVAAVAFVVKRLR